MSHLGKNTGAAANRGKIALVDCDNFFVSCERIFQPKLKNHPVVVLSSNDGCIVSRSNEAKQLGIPMGVPAFKYKDILTRHKVKTLSSNFSLYNDISNRVMSILQEFVYDFEIYSVDEAFLNLSTLQHKSAQEYCQKIRDNIYQWIGIPVSIGIASTKTLAKVASEEAKKKHTIKDSRGVVNLSNLDSKLTRQVLRNIDIEDVWGIGWQTAKKLHNLGVHNIRQFQMLSPRDIREYFNVTMLRTHMELNGISCHRVGPKTAPQKQLISSRSFGKEITTFTDMQEAVANFTSHAAERLRKKDLHAGVIGVFITTNKHKKGISQYSNFTTEKLIASTNHTPTLIKSAHRALSRIFRSGYSYKKALIHLTNLTSAKATQIPIGQQGFIALRGKEKNIDFAVDKINAKWGRNTVHSGALGVNQVWKPRQDTRSPRYTTSWHELPVI